jgi:prophage maintenance system killer protein
MTQSGHILNYHHPDDSQFSVQHITPERDRHESKLQELKDDDSKDVQTVREEIDGTTAHLIYTNTAPNQGLPDFNTDEEIIEWLSDNFSKATLPIVLTVYRAYRGVIDEEENAGNNIELYKQMELEKISEIVNTVHWQQSVADVGAQLLSEFILTHPMPNTNHRTGISLLERYLTSIDSEFTMPDTGKTDVWYSPAVDYVHESKRLLTLRRRTVHFRIAAEIGYTTVERKGDVTIDLDSVDLDVSDPYSHYSDAHLDRTRDFVDDLLEQADATHLREKTDDGKQAFVDRLRADQ